MAISPALLAVATVASTAIGVVGAINSANATAQAQNYQAMVAQRQKELNLVNANRALERSRAELIETDRQTRALLGSQVATQSASGLKLGGRSQALTRKTARMLGRQDARNVVDAGNIEAYNYRVAASDSGNEANFLRQSAKNSVLSGWLDAGSVLIGGLSSPSLRGLPSLMGSRRTLRPANTLGGLY